MQNYLIRSFRAGLVAALLVFVPVAAPAATTTCSTVAACVLGTNTASGLGVEGTSSSGYGVEGTSKTNDGVVGKASVNPTSASLGKAGVAGYDLSTNKKPYNSGVYGVSTYSTGVQGRSTDGFGVLANSSKGIGLSAVSGTTQFSGFTNAGIVAQSSSADGIIGVGKTTGIVGFVSDNCQDYQCPTPLQDEIPSGAAVVAGTDSDELGLSVETDTNQNIGIKGGVGASITAGSLGLYINPDEGSDGNPGLVINGNPGPRDYSGNFQGAIITGYYGVSITSQETGLAVSGGDNVNPTIYVQSGSQGAALFEGSTTSGIATSKLDDSGNLILAGKLTQKGTITNEMRAADGSYSASYGAQATTPTIEDMGEANVVSGAASVTIDPALRKSIDVSKGYLVFLTPQGSTTGLYVTDKSAAGFRVREIGNARDSLAFDYRIVAHPYAEHGQRLATMSAALLPTNHKKLFYRHLKPLRFNHGKLDKSSLPVASM